MKTKAILLMIATVFLFVTCSKEDDILDIKGEQSPMGQVGATVSSSSRVIAGVSNIFAEVVSLDNGVSSYSGSAKVTNPLFKNALSNVPGITIDGDLITATDLKFRSTTKGIEAVKGVDPGILVNYDSKVGDTYPLASGGIRKVVSKSSEDDYDFGFFLIKVMVIEENPNKWGVSKIKYWANHKFGIVGVEFTFDDQSTAKYPVFMSAPS